MSATKKASLIELKKFFFPTNTSAEFNEERKKLTPEDQAELCDLLGTEIEKGAVTLT